MSMKPCPETFPYPLIALDETDSTNRYISQLCNELQEPVAELTTVTAEFQTAGKGSAATLGKRKEARTCFSALSSILLFWKRAASLSYHKSCLFPLRKSWTDGRTKLR